MNFIGLSEKEENISREKYGSNEVPGGIPLGRALLTGLGGYSCRLFALCALLEIISVLLGLLKITDTISGAGEAVWAAAAAVVCALLEGFARYRSEALADRLCGTDKDACYTVFREDGKTARVKKSMLAVGDAVFLSAGDIVPADGAVRYGSMTVDQSVFGVLGSAEKTAPPAGLKTGGGPGLGSPYFLYGGSVVTGGGGVMKITAVGSGTRIADMKKPSQTSQTPQAPEAPERRAVPRIEAAVTVIAAAAVLIYKIIFGEYLGAFAAAAAVAAAGSIFGKGLISVMCSAGAVKRLYKMGVRLAGPETPEKAAGTGLLLTDRAGMLAEAEYTDYGVKFIDGNGKEYGGFKRIDRGLGEILKKAAACTSQAVEGYGGDALDRALFRFIGKGAGNMSGVRVQAAVRSSARDILCGTAVTVGGKQFTFVRGGAEILLERCSDSLGANGKKQKITNKSALLKLAETLSLTAGEDVVALAVSERGITDGQLPSGGYALIGLAALAREPFEDAEEQVSRLEELGVRVMLVTSESREAAICAAKSSGIRRGGGVVLTAGQLAKMSDKELSDRLDSIRAVSRAAPADKRRILRAAEEKGIKTCSGSGDGDWRFAAPGAGTADLARADATSESFGIRAAADIIEQAALSGTAVRAAFAVRAVCSVIVAAVLFL